MVNKGPNGRDCGRDHRSPVPHCDAPGEQVLGSDAVSVSIPSDFAASRDLQRRIIDEVQQAGYNTQNVFAIKLALEEAMINAIKHGNRLDMKKHVHVEYRITPEQVEIIIEDEGSGFRREDVPDPTLEENIAKCSGRGILLMEAYMNTVEYSNEGRRLRMVKKNEPDTVPGHQ